jgi:hypothetical protein
MNYNKIVLSNSLDNIRPDLKELVELEVNLEICYDPLSTSCEFVLTFDTLDKFKEENQKLFDLIKSNLYDIVNQTKNTISEQVYDENGVFIENGLLNLE